MGYADCAQEATPILPSRSQRSSSSRGGRHVQRSRDALVERKLGLLSPELELGGASRLHAFRGLALCVEGFGAVQHGHEARSRFLRGASHRLWRRLVAELRADGLRR
jgi:hypothetical protein